MKGNMKKYKGTQSSCRGGESSGFFLSPKGYIVEGMGGGDLGIFPSPKASIEGINSRAYIGEGSQSLFTEGKLGIFLNPKAYLERCRSEFS